MKFGVSETEIGQRLDSVAAAHLPRLSRAFVQKLCEDGRILVGGDSSKPGYKLRANDEIIINYDESDAKIPDIKLPVLYEDDDCIVLNKPAGLLTHALGKHGNEPSVASFIRQKTTTTPQNLNLLKVAPLTGEDFADFDGSDRAGVVHRLDRATSGVIIGAKNQAALSWLQKQFSQRKVKKTYAAVVKGAPKQREAVIDMPIERNPKAPATFRVGPNGKPATTRYQILHEGVHFSLLKLTPETGRTHQLRVHLQKIGHPIVGDPLYGGGTFGDRLFLHAERLEITLPNRERKIFTAPLPPEFHQKVAE